MIYKKNKPLQNSGLYIIGKNLYPYMILIAFTKEVHKKGKIRVKYSHLKYTAATNPMAEAKKISHCSPVLVCFCSIFSSFMQN